MTGAMSILRSGQFETNIEGMEKRRFGEMIREARERRGWRSIDLGVKIGRDGSFVSRLETGSFKETPPPDIIAGLSEHLSLDETDLLRLLGYFRTATVTTGEDVRDELRDELRTLVDLVNWRESPQLAYSLIQVINGIRQDQEAARTRRAAGAAQDR